MQRRETMKTIFILRHAKAVAKKETVPDKGRKLVKSGIEDSRDMAAAFREEKEMPDLILSSDAPRALETAEIFAQNLNYDLDDIVLNPKLYSLTTAASVMNIVKELDNKIKSVMIVGHDPLLSMCANYLVKDFTFTLPKASVLKIDCTAAKWGDISVGNNKPTLFLAPLKKKKTEKLKNNLYLLMENKIEKQIYNAVRRVDASGAAKIEKAIKKRSKQIAEDLIKKRKNLAMKTLEEIELFYISAGLISGTETSE